MAIPVTQSSPVGRNRIRLHQTIHGYAEGHRLLSGSVELPEHAARLMLIQSDIAGTASSRASESYLTGYPVPEIEVYAFARTWFATEMPRPGCVWTHTILIGFADLYSIGNLSDLLPIFRRPNVRVPYSADESLDFDPMLSKAPELALKNTRPELAISFAEAFFSTPESPVVIASANAEDYEPLFLSTWSLLWPALRRRLTFSTGSLSPRKYDGRTFDMQVLPPAAAREFVRVADARLINPDSVANVKEPDLVWPHMVALTNNPEHFFIFQRFLFDVADDSLGRTEIPNLAHIFLNLASRLQNDHTRQSYLEALRYVARIYPNARQAELLKKQCLTFRPDDGNDFDLWLFQELSSVDFGTAFSSPAVGLAEKATKLFQKEPNSADELLSKLLERELNPLGEQLAKGFISGWSEDALFRFLKRQSRFLPTILQLRPELAQNRRLWEDFRMRSSEVLDAVAAAGDWDQSGVSRLMEVMIDESADFDALHFVELFTTKAIKAIFARFGNQPIDYRNRWLEAASARPSVVLDFLSGTLEPVAEAIGGAAITLSPLAIDLDLFPIGVWTAALEQIKFDSLTSPTPRLEVCAFTIAIELRRPNSINADLGFSCFQLVHEAAAQQILPGRAWSVLEPLLPEVSPMRFWDKCERLRRAMIKVTVRRKWNIVAKLRAEPSAELFTRLINSAKSIDEGPEFIRSIGEIFRSASSGDIGGKSKQENLASKTGQIRQK
jgi:hypothetical protein